MKSVYLGLNESPYAPCDRVIQAAHAACNTGNRYPDFNARTLRAALAKRWEVTPDWVIAAGGSANVIMQTMIASGQGEIAFAWPSFDAFPEAAKGLRMPTHLTAINERGAPDLDDILKHTTPKTTMVIVCTPNPPTGGIVTHDELAVFLEKIPSRVIVLIDEAYAEFVRDDDAVRALEFVRNYPNVIMTRTFSKAYGMAGFRVGYGIAQPELAARIIQSGMPFAVPLPAQMAALAALENEAESMSRIDAVLAERDRLVAKLRKLGAEVVVGHGNFVWLPVGELAKQVGERLAKHGVRVKVLMPLGVRISVGTSEETDHLERAWLASNPLTS